MLEVSACWMLVRAVRAPHTKIGQYLTAMSVFLIFFRLKLNSQDDAFSLIVVPIFQGRYFSMPKFVPRQRKQKHRQKEPSAPVDTNVAELAPVSKDEKEARREKLREELRAQNSNVSSKKQKRLDKYIVRQMARLGKKLLTLRSGK